MGYFDELGLSVTDLQFDPARFADELIAGADIDDAQKEVLRAAVLNPRVSGTLKNAVALRRDAQSALDRARNLAVEAERTRDANFIWARDNKAALEAFTANGGRQRIEAPSGDLLSKADVIALLEDRDKKIAARIAEQDESYVGLLKDTAFLTQEFSKTFPGEPFDYGALQEFALTNHMTLRNAFPQFIAPKLEEKRTSDFKIALEKAKADAREEARMEFAAAREEQSSGELDGKGDLSSVFRDRLMGRRTTTLTDSAGKALEGEDAFVAAWGKTNGFTKSAADH
jgi:hypothetical protein